MAGGLLADSYGLRPVSLLPPVCSYSAFSSPCFASGKIPAGQQKRDAAHAGSGDILKNPKLVLSLFVTTLIIQVARAQLPPF